MVFEEEEEELVDAIETIKGRRGRPRKRPKKLHADKAYDGQKVQTGSEEARHQEPHCQQGRSREQREVGTTQVGARADTGVACEVPRRLTIRYEWWDDIHEAFLYLGCSLICLNYLT
jgi:hypothetical protein